MRKCWMLVLVLVQKHALWKCKGSNVAHVHGAHEPTQISTTPMVSMTEVMTEVRLEFRMQSKYVELLRSSQFKTSPWVLVSTQPAPEKN